MHRLIRLCLFVMVSILAIGLLVLSRASTVRLMSAEERRDSIGGQGVPGVVGGCCNTARTTACTPTIACLSSWTQCWNENGIRLCIALGTDCTTGPCFVPPAGIASSGCSDEDLCP